MTAGWARARHRRIGGAMMLPLLLAAALPLAAAEVRRVPSEDATQGVAADGDHVFAVSNHAISRIALADGKVAAHWDGDPALFPHLNSCVVAGADLVCAGSNYPSVPMVSRLERFDRVTLAHRETRILPGGIGSLTWVLPHGGGWWAGFANYDAKGGEPGRDHRFTALVRYDRQWHETARWRFPDAVLDRMSPRSASGGAWGADGLLYVTGHDRPEMYALRVPEGGGTLELVATIATPTDGQAIAWDPVRPRLLWSVERSTHQLVASRVPPVLPAP